MAFVHFCYTKTKNFQEKVLVFLNIHLVVYNLFRFSHEVELMILFIPFALLSFFPFKKHKWTLMIASFFNLPVRLCCLFIESPR